MAGDRASIFGDDQDDTPSVDVGGFKPKPRGKTRQVPDAEAVKAVSESGGFPSRQAPKPQPAAPQPAPQAPPAPQPAPQAPPAQQAQVQPAPQPVPQAQAASPIQTLRRRRTGRNVQINIKASAATIEALYAIADAEGWVLGETLEHAIAALKAQLEAERAGQGGRSRAKARPREPGGG